MKHWGSDGENGDPNAGHMRDTCGTVLGQVRDNFPAGSKISAAYLFARKRLGELTPKEKTGPKPNLLPQGNELSQVERKRRWENAALAEYWNHPPLKPRYDQSEFGSRLPNSPANRSASHCVKRITSAGIMFRFSRRRENWHRATRASI